MTKLAVQRPNARIPMVARMAMALGMPVLLCQGVCMWTQRLPAKGIDQDDGKKPKKPTRTPAQDSASNTKLTEPRIWPVPLLMLNPAPQSPKPSTKHAQPEARTINGGLALSSRRRGCWSSDKGGLRGGE